MGCSYLFSPFRFSCQCLKIDKSWFEPWFFGIESNRPTNCATPVSVVQAFLSVVILQFESRQNKWFRHQSSCPSQKTDRIELYFNCQSWMMRPERLKSNWSIIRFLTKEAERINWFGMKIGRRRILRKWHETEWRYIMNSTGLIF